MDREEFRRLQRAQDKAIKKKNKQPLYEWGLQFEQTLLSKMNDKYQKEFDFQFNKSIDYFMTALSYALHFSEDTQFDADKLNDFIADLNATINMFGTGEYSPDDYKKQLADDGIILRNLDEYKKGDE